MGKQKRDKPYEKSIYKLGVGMSLIFITLAIIGFLILLLPLIVEKYDFGKLGALGDTVGGFLNPIIAISAALLTFLAFYIQYQANAQIQIQFEKQNEDQLFFRLLDKLDSIKSAYEIKIGDEDYKGNEAFKKMISEANKGCYNELINIGKWLFVSKPNDISLWHYENFIVELDSKYETSGLDTAEFKRDEYINSDKSVDDLLNELNILIDEHHLCYFSNIFKEIGIEYFFYFLTPHQRSLVYEAEYNAIKYNFSAFIDGYHTSLFFLLDRVVNKLNDKYFYIEYLQNYFTTNEKAFIFYSFMHNELKFSQKKLIHQSGLLKGFKLTKSNFFMEVSDEKLSEEIDYFYNFFEIKYR